MKRLAPIVLFVSLLVRRSYAALLIIRTLYHIPFLRPLRRPIEMLFDPNSIRRHSRLAIPTRYVPVRGKLGEQLRVNLGDHIGWNIFLNGYFDLVPSLVALVLHRGSSGGVYLDIGANIGDTSIAVANRGVNTVGIDASAMAISELCHNIALNSPIPYTVVHAAVASSTIQRNGDIDSDYIKLHIPMGNTGAASVHAGWISSNARNSEMLASPRSVTDIVDSLSIKSVCCIKLDVEGAEHDAILGMKSILQRFHCPIVFEYRVDHLQQIGMDHISIVDLLPEGYECFAIESDQVQDTSANLRISDFDRNRSYENVIGVYRALPPELKAAGGRSGLDVQFDSKLDRPVISPQTSAA